MFPITIFQVIDVEVYPLTDVSPLIFPTISAFPSRFLNKYESHLILMPATSPTEMFNNLPRTASVAINLLHQHEKCSCYQAPYTHYMKLTRLNKSNLSPRLA